LNTAIQAFSAQRRDVIVDVVPRFSKVLAYLLNAKAEQSRSAARRQVQDGARLLVVFSNILGQVRVWERCRPLPGPDKTVVYPN